MLQPCVLGAQLLLLLADIGAGRQSVMYKPGAAMGEWNDCWDAQFSGLGTGVYNLRRLGPTYCYMDELEGCGLGPWLLALKLDPRDARFDYDSPIWTQNHPLNLENGVLTDFDFSIVKTRAMYLHETTTICLGLSVASKISWIPIHVPISTLTNIFRTGAVVSSNLGVGTWNQLHRDTVPLSDHCLSEGFNIESPDHVKVRIGARVSDHIACTQTSKFIGVGFECPFRGVPSYAGLGSIAGNVVRYKSSWAIVMVKEHEVFEYDLIPKENEPRFMVVCPEKEMVLRCLPHMHIKIKLALFGSNSSNFCHDDGLDKKNCHMTSVLRTVAEMCNNKVECKVQATSYLHRQTCPSVPKHLLIDYTCLVPGVTGLIPGLF